MGRKYLGKVTQNFRISPEFQAFCHREAKAAGKSLGDWLEDYVMQTKTADMDSQGQVLPKAVPEKTIETDDSTGKAVNEVVIALQAWLLAPSDMTSRDAFAAALKRCIDRG
jgi:hypothetical protein